MTDKTFTKYQLKVLSHVHNDWKHFVEITDEMYPERFIRSQQGLCRARVLKALDVLKERGVLIYKKSGYYRLYDDTTDVAH